MSFRPIEMKLDLFKPGDSERSRAVLLHLMEGLIRINRDYIGLYRVPTLYRAGVLYKAEASTECWQDIANVRQRGFGDCEDLACWRAAELRAKGIHAEPFITWRDKRNGKTIYHALVRWPDGRIEDPSRALGMRTRPVFEPVFIGVVP